MCAEVCILTLDSMASRTFPPSAVRCVALMPKNAQQLPIAQAMLFQTFCPGLPSHHPVSGLLSVETSHTDRREGSV